MQIKDTQEDQRQQQRQEASAVVDAIQDTVVSANHKIDESILSCDFEVDSQQAPLNAVNATNTMKELKRQTGKVVKDAPGQEHGSASVSMAISHVMDEEPIDINPVRNVATSREHNLAIQNK